MNRSRIIIKLLAAVLLVFLCGCSNGDPPLVSGSENNQEAVQVYFAKADIPKGTLLSGENIDDLLCLKEASDVALIETGFREGTDLTGYYAAVDIAEGNFIYASSLSAQYVAKETDASEKEEIYREILESHDFANTCITETVGRLSDIEVRIIFGSNDLVYSVREGDAESLLEMHVVDGDVYLHTKTTGKDAAGSTDSWCQAKGVQSINTNSFGTMFGDYQNPLFDKTTIKSLKYVKNEDGKDFVEVVFDSDDKDTASACTVVFDSESRSIVRVEYEQEETVNTGSVGSTYKIPFEIRILSDYRPEIPNIDEIEEIDEETMIERIGAAIINALYQ